MSKDVVLSWHGDLFANKIINNLDKILEDTAHEILSRSGEQVPHDEGTLELTGKVEKTQSGYEVSYGDGLGQNYAVAQHENLEYSHQRGRKAKYLEDPFNEVMGQLTDKIKGGLL